MEFLNWLTENSIWIVAVAAVIAAPAGAIVVGRMQTKIQKLTLEADYHRRLEGELINEFSFVFALLNEVNEEKRFGNHLDGVKYDKLRLAINKIHLKLDKTQPLEKKLKEKLDEIYNGLDAISIEEPTATRKEKTEKIGKKIKAARLVANDLIVNLRAKSKI